MNAGLPRLRGLPGRLRAAPYAALSLLVFLVAAYLCLVNLDYAALWHDEAPTALISKNLLEQGDITGWDGRNLTGGANGRTLNQELRDVLPPLMYAINTAGFSLFGVNEIGARVMPALIGLLALGVFYLLLRQQLANHPRLLFFLFLFAAWSAQLLLYFRQCRYYAFMVFGVIACFYLYECYWRSKKTAYLAAMTLVAVLSFFNHYTGGAALMLSLASWHLLLRSRETAWREWLAFGACGLLAVALGLGYLFFLGVIGGERSGFLEFTGVTGIGEYQGATPLLLLRIWIYTRDLFAADWISWPVLLWFAGMLLLHRQNHPRQPGISQPARKGNRSRPGKRGSRGSTGDSLPLAAVGKIVLMGALFALFSAVLSVQPVWAHPFADLRYYVGALPLLLTMKGLFTEWAWRKSKLAGAAALSILLFSSAGAAPFNLSMIFTGERTLGLHLFQFAREIHRPYRDSIRVVSEYLLEHAERDDLVYVPGFADREALMFATGHHVLFCCMLDQESPLPRSRVEALGAPLYITGNTPGWIIIFGDLSDKYQERLGTHYVMAAQPEVYHYPTQRPEINFHAFAPLPMKKHGVHILRRKGHH